MSDDESVRLWVDRYEEAWRSAGTDSLSELFSETVAYVPSPWSEPIRGLIALARFWERARDSASESFTMTSNIVAVDGNVAVVRVTVDYSPGDRWRDLWIMTFDPSGRCTTFEEWPFSPRQSDGHELDNTKPDG